LVFMFMRPRTKAYQTGGPVVTRGDVRADLMGFAITEAQEAQLFLSRTAPIL
jgi:hypothetical protein